MIFQLCSHSIVVSPHSRMLWFPYPDHVLFPRCFLIVCGTPLNKARGFWVFYSLISSSNPFVPWAESGKHALFQRRFQFGCIICLLWIIIFVDCLQFSIFRQFMEIFCSMRGGNFAVNIASIKNPCLKIDWQCKNLFSFQFIFLSLFIH